MNESFLNGIREDHDEDYERCYKMLKQWYQQSGTAPFKDLAEALDKQDLCNIARQYCYEENVPPVNSHQKVSGKPALIQSLP